MLRCIIFDFNGIIIDDEELHFRAFAKVLEEQGLDLTQQEYFATYLGLDDKGCLEAALSDKAPAPPSTERVMELVERKAEVYLDELEGNMRLFPGVVSLIRHLADQKDLHLAINSGARAHEIRHVLERAGLTGCFHATVSADEVTNGKPDPEGYLEACSRLKASVPALGDLSPSECLVIEDSPNGIKAAHRAGMACVGVTNSRSRAELQDAELVVDTLEGVTAETLRQASPT